MNKHFLLILIGLASLSLPQMIHSQERSAGSSVDVQMSWSALSTMVNAVDTKTTAVNSRVDQLVVCSKKGMVYAPGAAGIDADGCLNPKNTVNTTDYDNVVACNDQGLIYDKSARACIRPTANVTVPTCTNTVTSQSFRRSRWDNGNVGPNCATTSGWQATSSNEQNFVASGFCVTTTCR